MQSNFTQRKGNTRSSEEKEHLFIFKRSEGKHLLSSRNLLRAKRRNEWGGKMYFSHGSRHSKGTWILIDHSINYNVHYCFSNNSGRMVLITVSINGLKVSFCNIYVPNNPSEQLEFIQELNNCIIDKSELTNPIVGGD